MASATARGRGCTLFIALTFFFFFLMMMMMISWCSAEQHVVGDDRGWDPLSDIQGWASRKIFRVGDTLWFAYASGQQSVIELKSEEEFERCDLKNPIKLYDGGLDAVPLMQVGSRYFTSSRAEDCQYGMKVHVNVTSDGLDKYISDNFDVVSDGLDRTVPARLISVGMESGADDVPTLLLKSDGIDTHYSTSTSTSTSTSSIIASKLSSAAEWIKSKARIEALPVPVPVPVAVPVAEAPTSGTYELSSSLTYSFSICLTLSFASLITTVLYAMP